MSNRVRGAQKNTPLVDLQAFDITAAQREIVAMHAQDVEVIGMAFKYGGEEFDFEIELSVVARADERAASQGGQLIVRRWIALTGHVSFPCGNIRRR